VFERRKLAVAQKRVLTQVMIINFVPFLGMVAAAWLSHSSALLSGTFDNLGDALTYALSMAVVSAGALAKARVALFKGFLISFAALAVAVQVAWRLLHPETPVVMTMSIAAILNLAANSFCLWLLTAYKDDDVRFRIAAMDMVMTTGVSGCNRRQATWTATANAAKEIRNPLNRATRAFARAPAETTAILNA
jgi:Co/Zn/Cd efflux system component